MLVVIAAVAVVVVVVVDVVVTGDNDAATVAVTDACVTTIVPGAADVGCGNDVPLDMPDSALCHLPFCCNAALICAHRSLLHD